MRKKLYARLGAVFAAASMAAAMGAPSASADSGSPGGPTGDELFYCSASLSCWHWQDAANWARAVAEWKYPDSLHNGKGDAVRHCLWSGALANRVGYDHAMTLVMIHEDFTKSDLGEEYMDATNDSIGLDIGGRSHTEGGSDQWGWILVQCVAKADQGQLAGLDAVMGAY